MKSSTVKTHLLPVGRIFLLLVLSAVISGFSTPVTAQSLFTDDVKRDTPGQIIKPEDPFI